jgi:ferredoxin
MSEIDPIYKELAERVSSPNSELLAKILRRLANLEQARIIREMPAPPEEIAKKLGMKQETVDKNIRTLFENGVIAHGKSGWNVHKNWFFLHDTIGSSESKYDDDEFFDLAMEMQHETIKALGKRLKESDKPTVMQPQRVVPDWKAIKDIPGVLPCENTFEAFKDISPRVNINCACKRLYRNRKCKDEIPLKVCFIAGRSGQVALDRGLGREISHDEYLEIQERANGYGLVHLFPNNSSMPQSICNCHSCCCGQFLISAYTKPNFNIYSIAKSRFVTEVDPEKCTGCRTCVDTRCPVGAAQMKYYPEYGEERACIDAEACIGCGLCVLTCPSEARKMKLVRPPEHIPEPRKFSLSEVVGDFL